MKKNILKFFAMVAFCCCATLFVSNANVSAKVYHVGDSVTISDMDEKGYCLWEFGNGWGGHGGCYPAEFYMDFYADGVWQEKRTCTCTTPNKYSPTTYLDFQNYFVAANGKVVSVANGKAEVYIYVDMGKTWLGYSYNMQDMECYITLNSDPENRTLAGISVDMNGTEIGSNPDSSTVAYNTSASIIRKEITGYDFKGWKSSKGASTYLSNEVKYTVSNLTSDITVYAVYQKQQKTLSGIAVLEDGTKIGDSNNPNSAKVDYGDPASITRKEITGYDFKGWREKQSSGEPSGSETYKVSSLTENMTVYAVYREKVKEFQGYSKVSFDENSAGNTDTGWQSSGNTTASSTIACVSSTGSCKLKFTHGIKRTSGESGGKEGGYTIDRTNSSEWSTAGTKDISGTIGAEITKERSADISVGSTICDRNKFSTVVKYFSGTTESARTQACVSAPYNYKNNFSVDVPDYVYSGESMTMQLKAWTEDLYNSTIEKSFHTVGNATITWSIVANGTTYDADTKTLTNYSVDDTSQSINAPDVQAGSTVCIVATLSPASSSDNSSISASDCATVKKKPTVQVLGGGVYSSGKISTLLMNKKNVAGNSYSRIGANTNVFGSWDELLVLSKGSITGLASGATLAIVNTGNTLGSDNFCNYYGQYNPLTITNSKCNSLGNSGISKDGSSLADNIMTVIEEVIKEESNKINLIRTNEISNNIINSNYDSKNALSNLTQIVVYSDGDLNIHCGVTRIDAILIAKGTVNTCSDGGDTNNKIRSTQLTINGSILAQKLILGRTYGAATGYTNSNIPAEIINAATGFYLWGVENSESSDQLYISYSRELSPRY